MVGMIAASTENVARVFNIKQLVGNAVFGATFEKADGTIRTGSFRFDVAKHVSGVGRNYDADAVGNLIVFDMNKGAYRTIKIERLISLTVGGQTITLTETGN